MPSHLARVALRTSLLYALLGALWILLSDQAVAALVPDPAVAAAVQTYKGWGYVLATTLVLYGLLRGQLRRYERTARERAEAERRLQAELAERTRAEAEIRRLNAELEERVAARTGELARANDELRELNTLKDTLLTTTSHDLRSPLGAIQNMAELLIEEGALPPDSRHIPHAIARVAHQMADMINELLDLSRLEAGKVRLELIELRVSDVARQALALLAATASAKAITLELAVEPGEPHVLADWTRLSQVLNNLLSNAIKFTPSGGHVSVTVAPTPSYVRVAVADTGLGIPPESLTQLFAKFHQVHTRGTANEHGSGLGLAIALHLVELHSGSIEVTSQVGEGSTFAVYLPRPETPPAPQGAV